MTKEATSPVTESATEKMLGLLEHAWETQWALRLVCIILFFDMALMLHTQRGLPQWEPGDRALLSDVGWLAICIVTFSVLVAIVLPVVCIFLRQVGLALWLWLRDFLPAKEDPPYQRPLGCVPAGKLRDLALEGKDGFLLRLYKEHRRRKASAEFTTERFGDLTAAALSAACLDAVMPHCWAPGAVSVVGVLMQLLGEWKWAVIAVVLIGASSILKWAWFSDSPPAVIYYPPLDRVLREEERKARLR